MTTDGQTILQPAWVKPWAALILAVLMAGVGAGWVGATYAGSLDKRQERIENRLELLTLEMCAIRQAVAVPGYSLNCSNARTSLTSLQISRAAAVLPDLPPADPPVSGAAIVTILTGLAIGLFMLGTAGFFLCWSEIVRMRRRVHDHQSYFTAVNTELHLLDPEWVGFDLTKGTP